MTDKKHVVITGSTKGIGIGLAENFLRRGWSVTVSGRGQDAAMGTDDTTRSRRSEPRRGAPPRRAPIALVAVVIAIGLVAGACSDSDTSADDQATTTTTMRAGVPVGGTLRRAAAALRRPGQAA